MAGVGKGINEISSTDGAVMLRSRKEGEHSHSKSMGKLCEAGILAGESGTLALPSVIVFLCQQLRFKAT